MNIISKILTGILKLGSPSSDGISKSVAENHPEIKRMEKDLRKKAEELDRKRDKFNDELKEKYKGTSLDKYFRFGDDKKK